MLFEEFDDGSYRALLRSAYHYRARSSPSGRHTVTLARWEDHRKCRELRGRALLSQTAWTSGAGCRQRMIWPNLKRRETQVASGCRSGSAALDNRHHSDDNAHWHSRPQNPRRGAGVGMNTCQPSDQPNPRRSSTRGSNRRVVHLLFPDCERNAGIAVEVECHARCSAGIDQNELRRIATAIRNLRKDSGKTSTAVMSEIGNVVN